MSTLDTKSPFGSLRVAFGVAGLVALVVGILIMVWPGKTAAVVTALIGIELVLVGLVYLATGALSAGRGGWARFGLLMLGVLFVVAGIAALTNLGRATEFLAVFVAILVGLVWILEGFVSLFTLGETPSPVWSGIFGVVSILGGVVLFLSPLWAITVLWWLLGAGLAILGLVQLVRAITWKP